MFDVFVRSLGFSFVPVLVVWYICYRIYCKKMQKHFISFVQALSFFISLLFTSFIVALLQPGSFILAFIFALVTSGVSIFVFAKIFSTEDASSNTAAQKTDG